MSSCNGLLRPPLVNIPATRELSRSGGGPFAGKKTYRRAILLSRGAPLRSAALALVAGNHPVTTHHTMRGSDDGVLTLSSVVSDVEHDPVARPAKTMRALGVRVQRCVAPVPSPCVQHG
jgi:hypothetical protein